MVEEEEEEECGVGGEVLGGGNTIGEGGGIWSWGGGKEGIIHLFKFMVMLYCDKGK